MKRGGRALEIAENDVLRNSSSPIPRQFLFHSQGGKGRSVALSVQGLEFEQSFVLSDYKGNQNFFTTTDVSVSNLKDMLPCCDSATAGAS